MSHPPLLDEVSTGCCCPERASFEPSAHSQREPPSFETVASSQRRDRRSPVFGSHAGADGEAAERVACRASRAHLLLEGRGDLSSSRGRDGPAEGALATIDRFEGYPESEREAADGPCRANSHAAAREPRPSSLLRCCRTGRYPCRSHATAWGRERSPGAAV